MTAPTLLPTAVETAPSASGLALYVERDRSYVVVRRRLVGTMTRAEWDSPTHRHAALAAAWTAGIDAIRTNGEEFVAHAPVTLYRHPLTGVVEFADIGHAPKRQFITATGAARTRPLHPPRGLAWAREHTTYAQWAEGPLPHRTYDLEPAPSPFTDRGVQEVRHRNSALRNLIDSALGPAEFADVSRAMPTTDDLVDFRVRGVFRRPDFRVLVSKQDAERGSKILTSEGIVE